MAEEQLGSSGLSIDSTNIGFQLLKKHGWKEGTGLGVYEQGRLDPVPAYVKNNKRGLGAEKKRKKTPKSPTSSEGNNPNPNPNEAAALASSSKKTKALSKRMRKMLEFEKRMQEQEFERAFRREFWADNV